MVEAYILYQKQYQKAKGKKNTYTQQRKESKKIIVHWHLKIPFPNQNIYILGTLKLNSLSKFYLHSYGVTSYIQEFLSQRLNNQ